MSPGLFVFAAAGVSLGLNDVWRFPHLVVEHGSLWFPLLYLAGVALIGVPLLLAELTLVRLGHSRPSDNFGFVVKAPDASRLWQYAGIIVLITVFLILSYTTVVASWMTAYAVRSVTGGLEDISLGTARLLFRSLITDSERLLAWHTLFVLALGWVAARGVNSGIGRVSKYLVAAVFAIVVALGLSSQALFGDGLASTPEWSLNGSTWSAALVVDAIVQSFFTLGICMGAMMILGTYLPPAARVGPLVLSVVALDILFVALACFAVVPTLAAGADGEGVAFAVETVPMLLSAAPFGRVFLGAFYILMLLLLMTTALVLMEVLVAWWMEKTKKSRISAVLGVAAAVWGGGLLALLSFSVLSFEFEFVGEARNFGLFDMMDILSSRIMLPIIGLLMAVFVGWNITRMDFESAMGWNHAASVLHQLKRYWVPLIVAAILIFQVFGRVLISV